MKLVNEKVKENMRAWSLTAKKNSLIYGDTLDVGVVLIENLERDVKFLLSFAPEDKPEDVEKGLSPEFYHSLSYDSEVEIAVRIQGIRDQLNT